MMNVSCARWFVPVGLAASLLLASSWGCSSSSSAGTGSATIAAEADVETDAARGPHAALGDAPTAAEPEDAVDAAESTFAAVAALQAIQQAAATAPDNPYATHLGNDPAPAAGGSGNLWGAVPGGGHPTAPAEPPVVAAADVVMFGALSRAAVLPVLRSLAPQVDECRRTAEPPPDAPAGAVKLRVVVAPDGRVQSSSVSEDSTGDDGFGSCLLAAIGAAGFPEADGITVVTCTIPLRTDSAP